MQKPNGYDEAKASGDFIPVETGGHYCKILQVSERKSEKGKDMIVVLFDFCNPDRQVGYFDASYKSDPRPKEEKKWPFNGSKYIMVKDYSDDTKTSRSFKTFCTCVEKSNNFEIKWDDESDPNFNWSAQFKGKKIGCVYGEEENEYNGKRFMRSTPRYFCSIDSVAGASIPDPKYLDSNAKSAGATTKRDNGFVNVPDGDDEEIPF